MENFSGWNKNPVKLVVKQYIIQTKSLELKMIETDSKLNQTDLNIFKNT